MLFRSAILSLLFGSRSPILYSDHDECPAGIFTLTGHVDSFLLGLCSGCPVAGTRSRCRAASSPRRISRPGSVAAHAVLARGVVGLGRSSPRPSARGPVCAPLCRPPVGSLLPPSVGVPVVASYEGDDKLSLSERGHPRLSHTRVSFKEPSNLCYYTTVCFHVKA